MPSNSDGARSFWEPCWACRVVSGEFPGIVVLDYDVVVVAINPYSTSPGHSLIMPRRHVANIFELTTDLAGPVLTIAACVAKAAKSAFNADGITLRQNNEPASDQHLFHFHLHVVPRFLGDAEKFNGEPSLSSVEEQERCAQVLKNQIQRMS